MKQAYLVIGLGNPGPEYEGTRHNIGREVLLSAGKKFEFPAFTEAKTLQGLLTKGEAKKSLAILLLPQTFVNRSGTAVGKAARSLKIKPGSTILVHDDVDMLLGTTKLSFGRNSGGHKGVESVIRALKTKKFWRMRIGVQKRKRVPGEDLVLQKFRADEMLIAKKITKKSVDALMKAITESPERAMNEYNQ